MFENWKTLYRFGVWRIRLYIFKRPYTLCRANFRVSRFKNSVDSAYELLYIETPWFELCPWCNE